MSTKPPILLRPALAADADAVSAMSIAVWVDTYARDGLRRDLAREVLDAHGPRSVATRIASADASWLLAEIDGQLVGCAEVLSGSACPVPGSGLTIELRTLYVLPRFHRRGIGASLLGRAEASGAGLWIAVWTGNLNAIGFYGSRGYETIGTIEHVIEGVAHENRVLMRDAGQ